MVFEMEPLADSETGNKMISSRFRRPVFAEQTHVIVPVIRAAFGFLVTCGCGPRFWQVEKTVPVSAFHQRQQQLNSALKAEYLHLFGAERGSTYLRGPDRFASGNRAN